ncbi:hypothetical protein [Streptosporangium sp. NPDC000396]|uniref:hypothetical protein n=1 Tax=Streptosporangium sp. NPDC000396 TaxID=3366185 RepID=UPI0036AD0543
MALVWCPITPALVHSMTGLAGSSWDQESLDATWGRTGWPAPPGGSIARYLGDVQNTPVLTAGDWDVAVPWGGGVNGSRVKMFDVAFALYYEPDDEDPDDEDPEEDQDLLDLPESTPSERWRFEESATREQFGAAWQAGFEVVSDLLGPAEVVGQHGGSDDCWRHATWRVGSRLMIVAQGEDFMSYSLYEKAALHVVDFSATEDIPRGDDLYALLMGGVDPSSP